MSAELILGHRRSTLEVTDIMVMRNWKLLFMNGYECTGHDFFHYEILNLCQDRMNASLCMGII